MLRIELFSMILYFGTVLIMLLLDAVSDEFELLSSPNIRERSDRIEGEPLSSDSQLLESSALEFSICYSATSANESSLDLSSFRMVKSMPSIAP